MNDGKVMEAESALYSCMDDSCGWKKESLALLDGISCPNCYGPVWTHVKQKPNVEEEIKMSQAQDKAKEKVFNLFQEYDVEYIDHNVRDEYSISLVKKGKKEEK